MSLDSGQPVPIYSKLLLENKILLFFTFLLVLLGAVGLYAQHWATRWVTEGMTRDRLEAVLSSTYGPIGQSAATSDTTRLSALLREAAALDREIAYLLVEGVDGSLLTYAANSTPATSLLAARISSRPESVVPEPTEGRAFFETGIPLTAGGRAVGTLRVGVAEERIGPLPTRAVAMVIGIMVIPVALVLVLARVVVRKAVHPLKKLTRVADDISTGNLDPVVDFGVHVNCWEIKNCQRTDCKAYMNFDKQCWYIDGTPCEGYEPRFPQKLEGCRKCEVYQAHRGDEIVQLADAFKHMTGVLKESREDLVKSDDFQKRLIRNSFNGIVASDANDTITIFNRAAEELLGVSRDQVIGHKEWREFFLDGLERSMDLPLSWERTRRIRGFAPRESTIRREDGERVDVLLAGISLFERGIHIGKVFFFQDLREINRLREDLIRSERLAATGQAAAGISHSIKNILDGLLGGAYVFKAGKRRGDELKMEKGWDMVERNTGIISDLVKDLLNFAKERQPEYQAVQPAGLIEETLASLGLEEGGRVTVEMAIDPAAGAVSLDAHAFQQCLANLVRNAAEAIPEDRQGRVAVQYRVEGDRAVFTVSDDGVGMNPEILEKVKGGMFSTKGSKGTGLGLLVAQKIVGEHRGTLTIESEEGKGSTFRIEIPVNGEPVTT